MCMHTCTMHICTHKTVELTDSNFRTYSKLIVTKRMQDSSRDLHQGSSTELRGTPMYTHGQLICDRDPKWFSGGNDNDLNKL